MQHQRPASLKAFFAPNKLDLNLKHVPAVDMMSWHSIRRSPVLEPKSIPILQQSKETLPLLNIYTILFIQFILSLASNAIAILVDKYLFAGFK
jgi:hypothetical protein